MMSTIEIDQIAIVVIFLVICIASACVFYIQNRKAKQIHIQTVQHYKKAMQENELQIKFRKTNLLRYDFLKYNLSAVLKAQPSIKLP